MISRMRESEVVEGDEGARVMTSFGCAFSGEFAAGGREELKKLQLLCFS